MCSERKGSVFVFPTIVRMWQAMVGYLYFLCVNKKVFDLRLKSISVPSLTLQHCYF